MVQNFWGINLSMFFRRIVPVLFIFLFTFSCQNNNIKIEEKPLTVPREINDNNWEYYDSDDEYEPTDSISQDSDTP